MLYHYTSIEALKSILGNANSDEGICFWATRFDCFADEKEYKLGIEVIKRLLPRLEERLIPDRRMASSFVWEDIHGNDTLPFPYVISFTNREDNEYMWDNYAKRDHGVVLGIDDSVNIINDHTRNLAVKKCIYCGKTPEEELYKELENEYFASANAMLTGPRKDLAFAILSAYPQSFVALIGRYLLAYVAPRLKEEQFYSEDETRAILAPPRIEMLPLVEQIEDALKAIDVNAKEIKEMISREKKRTRENGQEVFYQELFLPGKLLKSVSVMNEGLVGQIKDVLSEKGFVGVEVKRVKIYGNGRPH